MSDNRRITDYGFEKESPEKLTPKLFAYAALFGFLFGYDTAITGCVASNSNFLRENFPHAYKNLMSPSSAGNDFNCKLFDDDRLNFYRSSMYLVAFLSSSIVAVIPRHICNKAIAGSWSILIGSLLSGGGYIATRILFGIGTGVLIMFVTTHLCELAPCRYRSRLIMWFQLSITIGILAANIVYFYVRNPMVNDNWVLGLASYSPVPLLLLLIMLHLVTKEIDVTNDQVREEYEDSSSGSAQIPVISIVFERKYRPQLFVLTCIPIIQQLTGFYACIIYAPVLFKTIGFSESDSGFFSITMCGVNCVVAILSFVSFDKFARRTLLMGGGILMYTGQMIVTLIMGEQQKNLSGMPKWNAILLVVAWCAYVAGFAWSWGPLGWLIPSEILPAKMRLAGHTISVSMNMLSMFFVTHFFMKGLCEKKYFAHLIIGNVVILMTVFVEIFVPETKGVPIKNVSQVWKTHPIWKKYIEGDGQ